MTLFQDLLNAGFTAEDIASVTEPTRATFTRPINDQEEEIYLNLIDPQRAAHRLDKEQLRSEYQTAISRLQQIESAASPTNAQVIAAIRDIAKYERLIIKILAKLI